MSCWTLWQRMPPRYQLTMRDTRTEDQEAAQAIDVTSRSSSATLRSPRLRTPRGARRTGSARARLCQDGTMLTSGVLPEDYPADLQFGPQNPVIPPRSSPYINNMKSQMRINLAKRKFDDGSFSFTNPSTFSYTPKPRATSAPAFPITKPSNTDNFHRVTSPKPHQSDAYPKQAQDSHSSPRQQQAHLQRGFSGGRFPKRPSSGYNVASECRRVTVSTISPFGEQRDLRAQGYTSPANRRPPPTQQDCVIGDYQVATLYVDKGRVTFFRKTRPDVTQSVYSAISPYNVARDDGSYLAHLRKAYLSGIRDLPKVSHKQPDLEKHTTIRERMDYDRKVGRILDYYVRTDVPRTWSVSRPPFAGYVTHPSQPVYGKQGVGSVGCGRRTPRAGTDSAISSHTISNETRIEFPTPRSSMGCTPVPNQAQAQVHTVDGGGFVRINAQARLHNRHPNFYLRTPMGPANQQGQDTEDSSCVCGMCRLEMEVALMAQLHQDLGVSVNTISTVQFGSGPDNNTSHTQQLNGLTGGQRILNSVTEEDHCPARPNSVSDTKPSLNTVSDETNKNSQGADTTCAASHHPTADLSITCTGKPVALEGTSLTVTLPVIEETNEVSPTVAESKTEPSETGDGTTIVNSESPLPADQDPQGQSETAFTGDSIQTQLSTVNTDIAERVMEENFTSTTDEQFQSNPSKQAESPDASELTVAKDDTKLEQRFEHVIHPRDDIKDDSDVNAPDVQTTSPRETEQQCRPAPILPENMKMKREEMSDKGNEIVENEKSVSNTTSQESTVTGSPDPTPSQSPLQMEVTLESFGEKRQSGMSHFVSSPLIVISLASDTEDSSKIDDTSDTHNKNEEKVEENQKSL